MALPATATITVHANDASTFHAALPVPQDEKTLAFMRASNPLAAKVFERAWGDPGFKQRLMTSPRQAFIEATGVTPPASLKLVPHENTPEAVPIGAYAPGTPIPPMGTPIGPGGPCMGGVQTITVGDHPTMGGPLTSSMLK